MKPHRPDRDRTGIFYFHPVMAYVGDVKGGNLTPTFVSLDFFHLSAPQFLTSFIIPFADPFINNHPLISSRPNPIQSYPYSSLISLVLFPFASKFCQTNGSSYYSHLVQPRSIFSAIQVSSLMYGFCIEKVKGCMKDFVDS